MTLDEIRNDLLRRIEAARINLATNAAELAAHDRAVAAMPVVANGTQYPCTCPHPLKPQRAKRRDIPALVREALTDKPQGLKQLAKKTGVAAWRLRRVINRMRLDHEAIAASSDDKTFWCPP